MAYGAFKFGRKSQIKVSSACFPCPQSFSSRRCTFMLNKFRCTYYCSLKTIINTNLNYKPDDMSSVMPSVKLDSTDAVWCVIRGRHFQQKTIATLLQRNIKALGNVVLNQCYPQQLIFMIKKQHHKLLINSNILLHQDCGSHPLFWNCFATALATVASCFEPLQRVGLHVLKQLHLTRCIIWVLWTVMYGKHLNTGKWDMNMFNVYTMNSLTCE